MAKFMKKPVEIEAYQLLPKLVEAALWDGGEKPSGVSFGAHSHNPKFRMLHSIHMTVVTIHGHETPVEFGDWIALEPDGVHYYPIKDEIFKATYDAV